MHNTAYIRDSLLIYKFKHTVDFGVVLPIFMRLICILRSCVPFVFVRGQIHDPANTELLGDECMNINYRISINILLMHC